jgi:hypothetical protein
MGKAKVSKKKKLEELKRDMEMVFAYVSDSFY